MHNRWRSPLSAALLISALAFVFLFVFRMAGCLEQIELAAYDKFISFRLEPSIPEPRIVLIAVSEQDIRNQSRWPLTDGTLAEVLSILLQHQPRAIGAVSVATKRTPRQAGADERARQADSGRTCGFV